MSKIDEFNKLREKFMRAKSEDRPQEEVEALHAQLMDMYNNMSPQEREVVRVSRQCQVVEGDPGTMNFGGFTIVIEGFSYVVKDEETSYVQFPGDLMFQISSMFWQAVNAVIQDFNSKEVWEKLIAEDPRMEAIGESDSVGFDVRVVHGLLGKPRTEDDG